MNAAVNVNGEPLKLWKSWYEKGENWKSAPTGAGRGAAFATTNENCGNNKILNSWATHCASLHCKLLQEKLTAGCMKTRKAGGANNRPATGWSKPS